MGMFDYYEPVPPLDCPWCGEAFVTWQGYDGPCALFVEVGGALVLDHHEHLVCGPRSPAGPCQDRLKAAVKKGDFAELVQVVALVADVAAQALGGDLDQREAADVLRQLNLKAAAIYEPVTR